MSPQLVSFGAQWNDFFLTNRGWQINVAQQTSFIIYFKSHTRLNIHIYRTDYWAYEYCWQSCNRKGKNNFLTIWWPLRTKYFPLTQYHWRNFKISLRDMFLAPYIPIYQQSSLQGTHPYVFSLEYLLWNHKLELYDEFSNKDRLSKLNFWLPSRGKNPQQ